MQFCRPCVLHELDWHHLWRLLMTGNFLRGYAKTLSSASLLVVAMLSSLLALDWRPNILSSWPGSSFSPPILGINYIPI